MADILIVDDSVSGRVLLGTLFKIDGHNPVLCADFMEAQAALLKRKSQETGIVAPFAAIVTDWLQPGTRDNNSGGAELLDFIRNNPVHRPQHLLVGSGNDVAKVIAPWADMSPTPQGIVKGNEPGQLNRAVRDLSKQLKKLNL